MGDRSLLSQRGSATVEFVMVVPLIVLVLVACIEVAALARVRVEVVAAAREGARVAATHPDPADAASAVKDALGERGDAARVTVRRPHVVGRAASVEVRLPTPLSAPFLSGIVVVLVGEATMRVER